MSATRAHTPAYIHDTHVKWSGARGYRPYITYIHIHTYMLHADHSQASTRARIRTHTHTIQTANKKRSSLTNNTQQQLYWLLSRVVLVEEKRQQQSQ